MNKLLTGDTAYFTFGALTVRVDRHHDGVAFTVDHHKNLSKGFTDLNEAAAYYRYLRDNGHRPVRDIVTEVGVLLAASAVLAEADAEVIHLRREPNPIACGATGPVRVTRTLSEVTCQPCIDAEDRRLGRRDDMTEHASASGTLDAYRHQDRPRRNTRTHAFRRPPSAAMLRLIRQHKNGTVQLDGRGNWLQLRAITDRGYGDPIYKPGTQIIDAVRLNERGLELAGQAVAA